MADWGTEKARSIYNVAVWSEGYFDVNADGDLVAYPDQDHSKKGISFPELTARFKEECSESFFAFIQRRDANAAQRFPLLRWMNDSVHLVEPFSAPGLNVLVAELEVLEAGILLAMPVNLRDS